LVAPAICAATVVVPAILAFSAAHWLSGRVRLLLLLIVVPLPVWLLTLLMLYLPPAPPSSFAWWATGMVMIAPVAIAWAIVGALGARMGWRNVR
jgi:hypothetical protein